MYIIIIIIIIIKIKRASLDGRFLDARDDVRPRVVPRTRDIPARAKDVLRDAQEIRLSNKSFIFNALVFKP